MAVIGLTSTLAFEVGPLGRHRQHASPPARCDGPRMERNFRLEAERTGTIVRGRRERVRLAGRARAAWSPRTRWARAVVAMLAMPGLLRRRHRPVRGNGRVSAAIAAGPRRPGERLLGVLLRMPAEELVEMAAVSRLRLRAGRLRARPGRRRCRCATTSPLAAAARRSGAGPGRRERAGPDPAGARPGCGGHHRAAPRRTPTPARWLSRRALPAGRHPRIRHVRPRRPVRPADAAAHRDRLLADTLSSA